MHLSISCLMGIPRIGAANRHAGEIFLIKSATDMPAERTHDITAMLLAWSQGDESAIKDLISVIYPELRRMARQHLRRQEHTLESAAVANEVYLKLVRAGGIPCENRAHFFALCAQIMRRILVDHARRNRQAKHGGGAVRVPLEEALLGTRMRGVELLALDEALKTLSGIDPRKGRVVELRCFGGLSVEETAGVLQISAETVQRDWRMAKTWLFRELSRNPAATPRG
jgi:RNA polymerase sigma factor (TIGR02999 family)